MPMTTGGGVSPTNYYGRVASYAAGLGTVSLEYFTVSLWHRWITEPALNSGYAEILYIRGRSGASPAEIRLEGGSAGTGTWGTRLRSVGLQTWNGGYTAAVNTGTDDIVEGQWYHYAIVGDGANGTKAYQDGVEVLSHSTSLIGIGDIDRIHNAGSQYSNQPAEGQIAHAKLWDAALTQADIAREMATGAPFRFSNIKCWRSFRNDTSDQLGFLLTDTATYANGTFGGSVPVAQRSQQPIIVEPAAATDVDVTPGTGSLTTTLFAPTVVATANVSVTPATGSLTTTLFAPVVVATANISVTPATVALVTARFAPVVVATANVSVTPATVALVTARFAPVVVATANVSVTPATAALVTTLFAPVVVATANVSVTPATVALVTARFAPTVSSAPSPVVGTGFQGISAGVGFLDDAHADFIGGPLSLIVFSQNANPFPAYLAPDLLAASGAVTVDTLGPGVPSTIVGRTGVAEQRRTTPSLDWHDDVHILPRTTINFGTVITTRQQTYEIFNAWRNRLVEVDAITPTGITPGATTPDMDVTDTRGSLSSFLDPSSTSNNTGLALGTLVKLDVQLSPDGLPLFDGYFEWTFDSTDTVRLYMEGLRIIFVPFPYESPLRETLAWRTDIIPSLDGREQRISIRKQPRQQFDLTYRLDGNDRQRMQALLFDWLGKQFGVPLWHEAIRLSAAASVEDKTLFVTGADQVDLRVGGLAVLRTNNYTYDVITISTVSATTITTTDGIQNSYPVNTTLMPLRTAWVRKTVAGSRYLTDLEDFNCSFESANNDTGALAASTTPGFWGTYNSRVYFDDCNVVEGSSVGVTFPQRIYQIDNASGLVSQSTLMDRSKQTMTKGFTLRSRSDIMIFRKLLIALKGKQTAFYLPTFGDDLTPTTGITAGAATIDITAMDYVRLVQNRLPMSLIRLSFTDGTEEIRTVSLSATVSTTVERLTVSVAWSVTRTVGQIQRIDFMELMRFDSDKVQLKWEHASLVRCSVPVIRVFDDNA